MGHQTLAGSATAISSTQFLEAEFESAAAF
jgi:hypothetical protein